MHVSIACGEQAMGRVSLWNALFRSPSKAFKKCEHALVSTGEERHNWFEEGA
jgi:hypothetical protein